jgi:hypothetical protein
MPSRRLHRPAPVAAALMAALALLATACSGGSGSADGSKTPATDRGPRAPSPLTGLPVDADLAARPAVTVKVDDSPEARPQSGLDKADVVMEEKVEGAVTRFLAVFQSEDASSVGPVRSVRPTDPALVSPIRGVFAYSGGIPAFEALIHKAPVVVLTETADQDVFDLRANRSRPYKTYTSTAKLRSKAGGQARPPARLFDFLPLGQAFGPPVATPAVHATVVFGRTTADWDYDPGSGLWRRTTNGTAHTVEGGAQLAFANVVVQRTRYRTTVYRDRSGAPVDEAAVVGTGPAIVLSQGKQVAATWSKASATVPTTYALADGSPVRLAPGRTLVELPPDTAAVTTR